MQNIKMNILSKISSDLDAFFKGIGVPKSVMASIGRTKNFKGMVKDFHAGITDQIYDVVDEELIESIRKKISKADGEDIYTESDFIDIQETVAEKVAKKPSSDYVSPVLFTGFLIWVFEKGGQNFLNKHNLPKTFELKNKRIQQAIANHATKTFQGIDETTSKWIGDQIIDGKTAGVSSKDLVDLILDKVPDYSQGRAERIVRTESSQIVSQAEQETAVNNGASHKYWKTAEDDRVSDECRANEAQGQIGINERFVSGAMTPPQHPNCRCVLDYYFTPFQGTIWAGE